MAKVTESASQRWARLVRSHRKALADEIDQLLLEPEMKLSSDMSVRDFVAWLHNPDTPL